MQLKFNEFYARVTLQISSQVRETQMATQRPNTSAPDGGWGWVVMVAAFFAALCVFGVLTCGGVLYIAIINKFQVSRPQAAFVPSLAFSISCFMGPVASSLSSHFTNRKVIFVGGIVAAFGALISAIFPSYLTMSIFYGGIMGCGCGLTIVPNITIVHTYFNRHRGFASSFSMAGAAIGVVIVPLLIEWVIEKYGLVESLFTISAILLQACPCAMLMRPLDPNSKPRRANLTRRGTEDEAKNLKTNGSEVPGDGESNALLKREKETAETERRQSSQAVEEKTIQMNLIQRLLSLIAVDPTIFRKKYFYLISISVMCFAYTYMSFMTILPDYVTTEGVEPVSLRMAVFLLSVLSIGDLVNRLVSGWLMDQKWVNRRCAYMLFLFGEGTLLMAHYPSHTYNGYIAVAVLLGMCIGGVMILPPILMFDLLGPKRFPMAYGISFSLNGLVIFFAAPSIAYVREVYGSYKPCIIVQSAALYFASFMWAMDFLWILWKRRVSSVEGHRLPQ